MKLIPKKLSKINLNIKPILHNQIILYFITFITVIDMVILLNEKDIFSFIVFILIALLTSFFSKNMIVILVIGLVVTHVIKYGNSSYINEGFKSDENSEDELDEASVHDKKDDKKGVKKNESSDKDDKIEYADLKKEYQDFEGIQNKILGALKDIDPLLSRAETFIQRFEKYKDQNKDKINGINITSE